VNLVGTVNHFDLFARKIQHSARRKWAVELEFEDRQQVVEILIELDPIEAHQTWPIPGAAPPVGIESLDGRAHGEL